MSLQDWKAAQAARRAERDKKANAVRLPLYDAVLELPGGEVLQLGRFTKRYAIIARNWYIGWLGLDLPLEEVPGEHFVKGWGSVTYYLGRSDYLREYNKRVREFMKQANLNRERELAQGA
jgi:hypothetical protein